MVSLRTDLNNTRIHLRSIGLTLGGDLLALVITDEATVFAIASLASTSIIITVRRVGIDRTIPIKVALFSSLPLFLKAFLFILLLVGSLLIETEAWIEGHPKDILLADRRNPYNLLCSSHMDTRLTRGVTSSTDGILRIPRRLGLPATHSLTARWRNADSAKRYFMRGSLESAREQNI